MSTTPPYDMHSQGGGGFTTFEARDAVALPMMLLAKATLSGPSGQRMVLEFGQTSAVVEGENLADLFAHLLSGRVKTMRVGQHATCSIRCIQILDV